MSQELASRVEYARAKYGLVGAGAVARGLLGRVRSRGDLLGPVVAGSVRVAARIVGSLRAGTPARSPAALNGVRAVLFVSEARQMPGAVQLLLHADVNWAGRSAIACDSDWPLAARAELHRRGASTAVVRTLPGNVGVSLVEGDTAALRHAQRLVTNAGLKPVTIDTGYAPLVQVAEILCSAAVTPMMDRAAGLFRAAGVRDNEAARLAARLTSETAAKFAHSGRQSWDWHVRPPNPEALAVLVGAVPEDLRGILSELILAGFADFARHPEVAERLRALFTLLKYQGPTVSGRAFRELADGERYAQRGSGLTGLDTQG